MAGELADIYLREHNLKKVDPLDVQFERELQSAKRAQADVQLIDSLPKEPKQQAPVEVAQTDGETQTEPQTSYVDKGKQILGDVGNYFVRLPRTVTGGWVEGMGHMMAGVVGPEAMQEADNWMKETMPDVHAQLAGIAENLETGDETTKEIAQFMAPFGVYMKGLKAVGMSEVGAGFTADAMTSYLNMDPHMERLSVIWAKAGLDQADFWSFMAQTDSDVDGRIKNTIENSALGVAGTAVFGVLRAYRMARNGELDLGPMAGTPSAQRGAVGFVEEVIEKDASFIPGGESIVRIKDPESGGIIKVLTRKDGKPSVMELYVPDEYRGKGVGKALQQQALERFPNLQGQVSSKAAAKNAYSMGRRPVNKPDASLDEVFKMIDENSSVNMTVPETK